MRLFFILLMIATCATLDASSAADVSITLRKSSTVKTGTVSLGQIADIASEDNLDSLSAILLGRAPAANRTRSLTLAYIKQRILQAGYNTESMSFYGHTRPLVLGAKANASGDEDTGDYVKKPSKVEAKPSEPALPASSTTKPVIVAKLENSVDDIVETALIDIRTLYSARFSYEIEVTEHARSRSLSTLKGNDLSLLKVQMRGRVLTLGRIDFALSVQSGTRQINGLTLTVFTEAIVQRVAVKRPLPKGTMLAATDIEIKNVRTTNLSEPGFTSISDVLELQLVRAMPAGEVFTDKHLKAARLIKRGQTVLVTQQVGRVTLQVEAEALEDGTKGDTIRLKRLVGKDSIEISALVTGSGKATTSKDKEQK